MGDFLTNYIHPDDYRLLGTPDRLSLDTFEERDRNDILHFFLPQCCGAFFELAHMTRRVCKLRTFELSSG